MHAVHHASPTPTRSLGGGAPRLAPGGLGVRLLLAVPKMPAAFRPRPSRAEEDVAALQRDKVSSHRSRSANDDKIFRRGGRLWSSDNPRPPTTTSMFGGSRSLNRV